MKRRSSSRISLNCEISSNESNVINQAATTLFQSNRMIVLNHLLGGWMHRFNHLFVRSFVPSMLRLFRLPNRIKSCSWLWRETDRCKTSSRRLFEIARWIVAIHSMCKYTNEALQLWLSTLYTLFVSIVCWLWWLQAYQQFCVWHEKYKRTAKNERQAKE